MRWAGLLLLASLSVCAAQPVSVTVQPNTCTIQTYQITKAPTTYALNVTTLPAANGDCSSSNILLSQDLLTTDTCQTDNSGNSDYGSEDSTGSPFCQSGYNTTDASCIQEVDYYNTTVTGSLGPLTSGVFFNNTFCYDAATFFFVYNSCDQPLTFTYEIIEAQDPTYTNAFCTIYDYGTVSHVTAIVVGCIIGVIVLIFVIAICCGAFVPCCAACAGLALLRSSRRQNAMAPGPTPPAQFQPVHAGGAQSYQPFDQYQQYPPQQYPPQQYPPQPYPGPAPAVGAPAYGAQQYSAGAAPIYGGFPPQTGGTAEMADFTKPQYGPVGGAPRV